MTTVYFVRHAEAEGNLYRRAQGQYDGVITERGYRQIAALARRFAPVHFDAVYASDLTRTRTTALAAYWTHGLALRAEPAFREVRMGAWEGLPWAQIEQIDPEGLESFNTDCEHWRVEGAETIPEVGERMLGGLRRVIAAHPDGTAAIFSHGMALRTLLGLLHGMSYREIDRTGHLENTSVTKLEAEKGEIRVIYEDSFSHLGADLTTLRGQAWTRNPRGFEGGVWYEPREDGGFCVLSEQGPVGGVALGAVEGRTAELCELWLDESARGKNLAVRLIGQATAAARAKGCDKLRCRIERGNAPAERLARRDGFRPVRETDSSVEYEKYFGYTEAYGIEKLRAALGK